ncbi:hypothetical protein CVT25_004928 [Psilocybe cyanescens]|uniref:Histone chaperone RTT106/FACT complex subunit SPT16-like middle domain-containing protein n=1 Tax=Psilocybe cyanescens TaxID=93625 RepID=A0A409XTW0_PSICY|nr:hypothetical protein CVT25_004928 [Psilocybe cyanescens]
MASESHFLRSIIPTLPTEISSKIRSLCTSTPNEVMLENLVRFLVGGEYAPETSKGIQDQWVEKQTATKKVITGLLPAQLSEKKRAREEEEEEANDSQHVKKQRLSDTTPATTTTTRINGNTTPLDPGAPLYTLHAISTSSPVRKKVDITIHEHAIVMLNPTSRATEATIPLSSLRRAFIVPTRGKQKPHWTVILLSSDIPDKGKPPAAGANNSILSENQQVIFGVDATTGSAKFSWSTYKNATGEPSTSVLPKSSPTLPTLLEFLSHLSVPLIQPDTSVFKSACPGIGSSSSSNGIPGVEAHRGVKSGNLWFSSEGILWGESKPCEFWAVRDLYGKVDGVRIMGSERTCSVTLARRRSAGQDGVEGENQEEVEVEVEVEETEFSMIDGKEREGITEWVRKHRHLFEKPKILSSTAAEGTVVAPPEKLKVKNTGPMTIRTMDEGSDSEDEDFSTSVSDLDGSERSSDGDSSDDDDEGDGGSSNGKEEEEEEEDSGGSEDEVLDPAHHPLLRPGAIPKKMSKAALEMAVGVIEDAFVGGGGQGADEEEEEEEDELDD